MSIFLKRIFDPLSGAGLALVLTLVTALALTACPTDGGPEPENKPGTGDGSTTVINAKAPVITAQPQGAVYTLNASASLTVSASSPDNGTLSYEWSKSSDGTTWTPITGATGAAYTPPTDTAGSTLYKVKVTNTIANNGDGGTKTAAVESGTAIITVLSLSSAPTSLTLSFASPSFGIGQPLSGWTLTADGTDISGDVVAGNFIGYDNTTAGSKTVSITVLGVSSNNVSLTVQTLAQRIAAVPASGTSTIILYGDEPFTAVSSENITGGKNITLKGEGRERTLSLSGNGHMFYIYNGSLTLDSNVTLKGHASNTLPLVFVRDSFAFLTMKAGAKITGNTNASTSVPGSGVSVNINGTFTMNGGEISGNTDSFGGGVAVLGGSFTMNDGKISGNTAQHGGGVAVWTTFTMKGGEISDNTGAAAGAGVWVGTSAIFTMSGTAKITGNTARASGSHKGHSGGVHVWGGAFTMSGGTISGNTADGVGGGVNVGDSEDEDGSMLANGTFTMSGGTISNNTASDSGGGVHVSDGDFTMEDGTISGNISSDNGGGVQVGDGTFTMEDGTISGNTAPMGGGVFVDDGDFTMEDGTISGNTAPMGGGVFVDDGDFTMEDGTISDNTASMIGGGVGVVGGTVAMDAGTISGNTALYGGGVGIIGANSGMGITGGNFDKTGGTIYGDTDSNPNNSNAEDNTATSTEGGAFWGHAVLYLADFTVGGDGNLIPATWYYRNETLNTTDAISTSTLPASGTGDNWTKVEM